MIANLHEPSDFFVLYFSLLADTMCLVCDHGLDTGDELNVRINSNKRCQP